MLRPRALLKFATFSKTLIATDVEVAIPCDRFAKTTLDKSNLSIYTKCREKVI